MTTTRMPRGKRPHLPDIGGNQGRAKLKLVEGSLDRHLRDMRNTSGFGELLLASGAVEGPVKPLKPGLRRRFWAWLRRVL
jgi:hypothetical protein